MELHTRPSSCSYRLLLAHGIARLVGSLISVVLLFSPAFGNAQPFVPQDDATLVERLPGAIVALSKDLRAQELRTNDSRVNAAVSDQASTAPGTSATQAQALLQQALAAYQIAVREQDPRSYGHTLAVLERWPDELRKPPLIHILTAAVLQHGHEFQQALAELERALAIEPGNAQALLMRAQISLVTADYETASDSCESLRALVRYEIALNCQTQVDSLTGNAQASLTAINTRLARGPELIPQDYVELQITAATIAHRLGRNQEAERHYQSALQLSPDSAYVLVHYATLLMEAGRPADAVALLITQPEDGISTELKIIQTEALLASSEPGAQTQGQEHLHELNLFFQNAFLREEAPHKEYARFALNVLHDSESALLSARENWALQKEPSDTLLLAQAASAAADSRLLTEIARWVDAAGTEDVRLVAVLPPHDTDHTSTGVPL